MKVGRSGWRSNGWGTQGVETEGGAVVSFSESISFDQVPMRSPKKRTKDRGETRDVSGSGDKGEEEL